MKNKLVIRNLYSRPIDQLDELTKSIDALSTNKMLTELLKLRVSQINGCDFCIQLHTSGALQNGIGRDKINKLSKWRNSKQYNKREKVALEIAESITIDSGKHLPKVICHMANEIFTDAQLSEIILTVSVINTWNRISVTSKRINSIRN